MTDRLNVLWTDVAGKMSDITPDQLGTYLTLCVDELGSDVTVLDLRKLQGQPEVMHTLAQRLQFPSYFGGNLDALFDVVSERVTQPADSHTAPPQTWLFKSSVAQEKMLFPVADTLRDALAGATGVAVTVLWLVYA
ncbi:barstar family protein [Hydromonas duriensis]|uniref:Barstar (Barnase inhibitor) n=1 Tax=Hydromonas duriensis TaxID=1527608 RepID=A0A4R6Y784_9BURK|nr:barstar family protein [Hydromonas duriensis]TDR31176.1 barstar (barnase inhibitor) [Hydromonas duriensis]